MIIYEFRPNGSLQLDMFHGQGPIWTTYYFLIHSNTQLYLPRAAFWLIKLS